MRSFTVFRATLSILQPLQNTETTFTYISGSVQDSTIQKDECFSQTETSPVIQ